MAIPDSFLDDLNSRLNIVDVVSAYVPLTKRGGNYWGLCPFHHEKTPSFSVNESKQIFHCFGCGKGGGAIRFVMEMDGLPFPEAVRKLAEQAGLQVPEESPGDGAWREKRRRVLELNKEAARFYRAMLSDPRGAAVASYIRDKRRISPKFSARFGLGAAPDAWDSLIQAMGGKGYDKADLIEAGLAVAGKGGGVYDKYRNRLMLPVIDPRGDVIGFTSRVMDDSTPKYLNSPETPVFDKRRNLYGLNYARRARSNNIILCEGNIDVITLHQAGFDNAVASMGTALTVEQTRLLSRYTKELVLCYDNDSAGQAATEKAIELLKNSEFTVRVLQLPRRLPHRVPEGEPLPPEAFHQKQPLLQRGPLRLLLLGPPDDQHELPLGTLLLIPGGGLAQGGAENLLVELGQLPAQRDPPVPESGQQIVQRRPQAVGSLIKDQRPLLPQQTLEPFPPLGLVRRQEPLEGEPPCGQPADRQRGDQRAAPRHRLDRHPAFRAETHQVLPRVGDGGGARVRHQGAALPRLNPAEDGGPRGVAVVAVVGRHGLFQPQVVQQLHRHPGVLGGQEVRLLQRLRRPAADVPQVADGRGHQVQRSAHSGASSRK